LTFDGGNDEVGSVPADLRKRMGRVRSVNPFLRCRSDKLCATYRFERLRLRGEHLRCGEYAFLGPCLTFGWASRKGNCSDIIIVSD
jgi:hypothetical protein